MYVKINDTKYPCSNMREDGGIVFSGVVGMDKPPTGVISLCADDGFELAAADVAGYKRVLLADGTLTLTNAPEPTPPTEAELLAAARTAAIERISGKCSTAIYAGVTVDGKHYRLQETDQLSLNAAIGLANTGTSISYAADGETGKTMTTAELAAVGKAAYDWGYVCRNYYALLHTWIARETDKMVLAGIDFGSKLPDDLMQQLAATLSGAGIDVTKYTAALTGGGSNG